jgi:UDP-3-O-[3-hydroxymyristoyl] glucosamine N-acyltransferase
VSPSRQNRGTDSGGGGANSITAADIAARLGGELLGDSGSAITGVAPLDKAGSRDISLLVSAKYADEYASTGAAVVLIKAEFRDLATNAPTRVIVEQPLQGVLSLLPDLYPEERDAEGVHHSAVLGRGVVLGVGVCIGPYAVIGARSHIGDGSIVGPHCVVGDDVELGSEVRLHAAVTIYPRSVLGDRTIVHSGARIGSDGFGYVSKAVGHDKIRHVGRVIIGNDVEIGANTTIDRGSIGDTLIGEGTKIDNLVHIAHNVRIGKYCLLAAQVGIAGSCRVEDGAVLGGQAGIAGHLRIGRGARLGAQAGAIGHIPAGETWSGFPARPHRETMKGAANLIKLGSMMKKLESMLEERK